MAQQYSFRHYGTAEGLQNLTVLSLAQDREGYIWAGTEGGLYRYDGTRFRLMGPVEGLACGTEIHTLYVATDGALWANACAQIFRFDGHAFHSIPIAKGPLQGAQRIAEDVHGHVIVSSTTGLQEALPAGGGTFAVRSYRLTAALEQKPMHGILRHGQQLWFGCELHLCLEEGGRVLTYGPAQGLPEDSWDAIAIAPDGSVWARSPSRLYRKPPGQDHMIQEKPDIGSSMFWGAMTVARDGSVIVPTDQGLAIRSAAEWTVVDRRRGLQSPMISAALEDRAGSVWIGLIGAGLARWLGRGEWEAWTEAQGLPSNVVWSIRRDRAGALWVGTAQGLARLQGGQPLRVWTTKEGLGGDNVRWLGETSDGSIWAVSRPGGLTRLQPAIGRIHQVSRRDLDCGALGSIFVDRQDRIWLATTCGVFLNPRPTVSERFLRIDQPPQLRRRTWYLAMDSAGALWVTNPDGLWRMQDGVWRHYGEPEGLLSGDPYVPALAPDGTLWLRHRSDAGVERLQLSGDRIIHADPIVPADPQSNAVTAFHGFDAFGNFWRGGADGVAVLSANSWTQFSTEDGLIWNDTDGEAFWADPDGSVWIGTSGGVAHYRSPRAGGLGPPVADPAITRMEIDQKSRVVRAEFSTLDYKREQLVRFAYRLDGDHWSATAERTITFAGIGPGGHRLEIRSQVRDGPLSPKVAVAEFQIELKWWETWWFRTAVLLLAAGAVWGLVLWRHRLLRLRNRHLEQAVRQRTAELESERTKVLEEKRRADEASKAKGRFLATMSHEIRTPMNAIIGMTHLALERAQDDEQREYLEAVRSSGDSLLGVLNDILDFSKIEAGHMELALESFGLRRLVFETCRIFEFSAKQKALDLSWYVEAGVPDALVANPQRIRQVLSNLLSNAVKFTPKGRVSVSVTRHEDATGSLMLHFAIQDTGIGIPPGKVNSIFEAFQQLDGSTSRKYGGTGLGLAISQKLVGIMGGRMWVDSTAGQGSEFHFTTRCRTAETAPEAVATPPGPDAAEAVAELHILVAEDNLINQRLAQRTLEKAGHSVVLADNGLRALECLAAGRFDVVLMDVQMPEMDGFEAVRRIRETERTSGRHQPVIAMTAHAMLGDRERCLEAGMDGYLAKPFDPKQLRELLVSLSKNMTPCTPSDNGSVQA
ncbi:MAG: ATP-binding protein [Bryobacteraceae bacterium]